MSAFKGTPGNWSTYDGNVVLTDGEGGPFLVAKLAGWMPKEQQAANAAVMAAGPKMLAAMQRQVANIERWLDTGEAASPEESRSIYEELKAAIAKATGGAA